MVNIQKLERDLRTVRRALDRDKQGYDADGYNEEGKDRYGRSREMMERYAKITRLAFDSLTPKQQATQHKAWNLQKKYFKQAEIWENQPQEVKQKSQLFSEYNSLNPICKQSFIAYKMMTKKEYKFCVDTSLVLIRAERKFQSSTEGLHSVPQKKVKP